MFGTALQEDRDWICAPQGLVDGGMQGECPRTLSRGQAFTGFSLRQEHRISKCREPLRGRSAPKIHGCSCSGHWDTEQKGCKEGGGCLSQGAENSSRLGPAHPFLVGIFMLMRTEEEEEEEENM